MSRLSLVLVAAAMTAVAPASAENGVPPPGTAESPANTALPSPISPVAETRDLNPNAVDLATVPDPLRALTNLTVYSRGVDIGRILNVELDVTGAPSRVEIGFNSGRAPAWIDATHVRYDPNARKIVTTMDVNAMVKEASRAH